METEKRTSRNLKIRKYISEILYTPSEIKIEFKIESLLGSSTSLSSMSADRRHSTDEPFGLDSLGAGAERGSARNGEQAISEGGGGAWVVNKKRVRMQPDGCPILPVNNLIINIKNEVFGDSRLIRNV